MVYLTSGRIDLATSFSLFTPEITRDFTRIYPAYREPVTARPLDAFMGVEDPRIYDLELKPEWHQVALFNSSKENENIIVPLSGDRVLSGAIGLDPAGTYYVYDFWGDSLLGKFNGSDKIEKVLEPSHCVMLSIRKAESHPQVISTNRHILQGWVDLADVKWDQKRKVLRGIARAVAGDPFKIVLATNGHKPLRCNLAGAESRIELTADTNGICSVTIDSRQTKETVWEVMFE